MSDQSDESEPIDLSSLTELQLMPDWVKGGSAPAKKFRDSDAERGSPKGKSGGGFKGKGGGGFKGRGEDNRGGPRGGGAKSGGFKGRSDGDQRSRGARSSGPKGRGRGDRDQRNQRDQRDQRGGRRDSPPQTPPPKDISAALAPGDVAVKQLADQIKKTLRAYPVFDIAKLVIAGRDRYSIEFKRESEEAPELFFCPADGSAWLQRAEALSNLAATPAFGEYYLAESIQGDPPKGNYTAIAVCGMSNALLGPPNHHSYQSNIARLHRQRFANMPIDKYKSRIRVEHDEEIVERWKTEQSVHHRYTYYPDGVPAEIAAAADEAEEQASSEDSAPQPDDAPETAEAPEASDPPEEEQTPEETGEKPEEDQPAGDEPQEVEEDKPSEGEASDEEDQADEEDKPEEDQPADDEAPGEEEPPEAKADATDEPSTEPEAASLVFESREAAERHFAEHHGTELIKPVQSANVNGAITGKQLSPGLLTLLRGVADNARKHPASLVQPLCGMLSAEGLKFFKRGRQIYACVTRPKPLSDDSTLSSPIRAIIEFLREHKRCKVDALLAGLAPATAAPDSASKPEGANEPEGAAETGEKAATKKPSVPALTPEQINVLKDLRWLLLEGAVIAFDTGHMELAVSKSPPMATKQPKAKKKTAKPVKVAAEAPKANDDSAPAPGPDSAPDSAPASAPDSAPASAPARSGEE